ncbi:MAG: hypothetical protein B0A82_08415 [Alkalinema sp. CACIAM 70d]|nr:MAG: hypothetical protein B0A82_08415 [Alkalinema sp. CACIAM 70d]
MQVIMAPLQSHPLASDFAIVQEPSVRDYFEPGHVYEVWTPIDSPKAEQVLLDLLASADGNLR